MAWESTAVRRYLHLGGKATEMGVSVFTFDGRGHGSLRGKTGCFTLDSYPRLTSRHDALFVIR